MWTYTPPLRDMQFVIEEVLDAPALWREVPALAECDVDTARAVLEEAGKFAAGVLAPINGAADLEGCLWQDGEVRTPAGYREAYAAFVEGGWAALACDSEDGGQGLPAVLNAALNEMIAAANHGCTRASCTAPTTACARTAAPSCKSSTSLSWPAANGWRR
jgi:alkylation response protein AidB-like acyl-CoA dehydrogenase